MDLKADPGLTSHIPTAGTTAARARDILASTLPSSIDTAGCFSATVKYGAALTGSDSWFAGSDVALYSNSATELAAFAGDSAEAAITISSMLSTSTSARMYWGGATMGVVKGATSDTQAFSGSASALGIVTFADYLNGHILSIRVGTSAAGCQ
jgi:hypothetical protein